MCLGYFNIMTDCLVFKCVFKNVLLNYRQWMIQTTYLISCFQIKKNGLRRADKLKVLRRIQSTLFKMDTFGMGT